jgi:hypothetical protein
MARSETFLAITVTRAGERRRAAATHLGESRVVVDPDGDRAGVSIGE